MSCGPQGEAMHNSLGVRAIGRVDVNRLCRLMEDVATHSDRRAVAAALRMDEAVMRDELARICRDGEITRPFYEAMCIPGMTSPLTFATCLLNVMRAKEGRPRITAADMRRAVNALIADIDGRG